MSCATAEKCTLCTWYIVPGCIIRRVTTSLFFSDALVTLKYLVCGQWRTGWLRCCSTYWYTLIYSRYRRMLPARQQYQVQQRVLYVDTRTGVDQVPFS